MTSKPWMPLYIADYLADTAHLGALQSGAYLHLIMHYWQHSGLPVGEDALQRIARLTAPEWKRERPTLAAFFQDGWKHKRIDAEIEHAGEVSRKRREAAEQRRNKPEAKAPAIDDAIAEQLQEQKHLHAGASSQSQTTSSEANASAAEPLDERTKLFRFGLQTLVDLTGRKAPALRPMIGRWLKAADDDCRRINRLIEDCRIDRPVDPVAFIEASLKPKDNRNGGGGNSRESASETLRRSIFAEAEKRSGLGAGQAGPDERDEPAASLVQPHRGVDFDLEIPAILRRQ